MSNAFKASRDIIVRTENWSEALKFYGLGSGLPITEKGENDRRFRNRLFLPLRLTGQRTWTGL